MREARLKANIWVAAALRQGMLDNKPGILVRRGDADAGGVLVKLYGRLGYIVLSPFREMDGSLCWLRATGTEPVADDVVEAYISKQLRIDPDLWVLEFDTTDYIPPFEGKII